MKRTTTIRLLLVSLALICAAGVFLLQRNSRRFSLPYRDAFAKQEAGEWEPMGGYWSVREGQVINRSDEPGAKLITGSPLWTNYQVDTDLELRAHGGDVGLALRINDPKMGINAYRGYYVGMRSVDSAVVVGRSDNGWLEGRPVPMSGGVQTGVWYHLKAVVVGCEIAAEATNLSSHQTTFAAFRDSPAGCIPSGKIGLRSTDTSGAWKDIQVKTATSADLQPILQHVSLIDSPQYPTREEAYSRMRMKYFPDYPHFEYSGAAETSFTASAPPLVPVELLRTQRYIGESVRILGLVTFTDPIYVQDATGGVLLQVTNPESVNIGDEIEVTGQVVSGGFSPVLYGREVHLLREANAASPVSITATEAASGAHAGTLVEVTGAVNKRYRLANGSVQLELTDPAQKFAALLTGNLFNEASQSWTAGSTIRVRGICTMNPKGSSENSFLILVASASDVSVISGPPWWSGWRLARTIAFILLLAASGTYLFIRLEQSKHRAVLHEREHLAHQMHDTLAQSFAGVGYYLQSIRRSLREVPQLPAELLGELDVACDMVTNTHREASASIAALHPDGNGDLLNLLQRAAIAMLGGERIPITLQREGAQRPASPTVTDALFHIGREAISNVLRHSAATEMILRLQFQSKQLLLSVQDNGCGFDADEQEGGFGLQSMRRRCRAIGAEFQVRSSPGSGCTVSIRAPYKVPMAAAGKLRAFLGLR